MAILPIRKYGDDVLRDPAKPIDAIDASLQKLIDDMIDTMYAAPGVGLAANQVGVARQLMIIDLSVGKRAGECHVFINPEIIESEGEITEEEGCLSIPDFTAEIERPAKTRVSYIDREGRQQEMELEGIWSTLVQHEIDHLNGVLFIDYLSRLKRDMVVRKFTKQKRTEAL